MSSGFGSESSKKKKSVKQFYLDKLFHEAKKNFDARNFLKSKEILNNLYDLGYRSLDSLYLLAEIYISIEQNEELIFIIEDFFKKNIQKDLKLIAYLGLAYIKNGDLDYGRELLKKTILESKFNIQDSKFILIIVLQSKQNDLSINLISNLHKLDPSNANNLFNLGNLFFEERKYDFAIQNFLEGIKIDPNNEYAYSNLAGTYEEVLDYKNAIKYYKKAFLLNDQLLQVREKLIQLQPKLCDWSLYKNFPKYSATISISSSLIPTPLGK